MRLMASNKTEFLELEYCTFLDLAGSCALLRMASSASLSLALTTGSSGKGWKEERGGHCNNDPRGKLTGFRAREWYNGA